MLEEDRAYCQIRPDVDTTAPRRARAMVAKALADWGLTSLLDDVTLCVSELVTNTLNEHAESIFVRAEWHRDEHLIEIAVWDDAPGTPETRNPSSCDSGGRGLNIVEALADEWGHRAAGDGKIVWARFRTSTGGECDAA